MKLLVFLLFISSYAFAFNLQEIKSDPCPRKFKRPAFLSCRDYQEINKLTNTTPFKSVSVLRASVSDNYGGVPSPGDRVASSFEATMFKHAIPHRPSHVILKEKHQFEQKMLNSDLVVAIDLFYWNSVFLDEGKCDVDSVKKQLKQ